MPIVQKLMDSLVARYGKAKGEAAYYAMEGEGKGPFGPNGKHRDLHEAFVAKHGLPGTTQGKKKAVAPAKGRRPGSAGKRPKIVPRRR